MSSTDANSSVASAAIRIPSREQQRGATSSATAAAMTNGTGNNQGAAAGSNAFSPASSSSHQTRASHSATAPIPAPAVSSSPGLEPISYSSSPSNNVHTRGADGAASAGVFGRVVRKLSKRVAPPSSRRNRDDAGAGDATSRPNGASIDAQPPAYSAVVNADGSTDGSGGSGSGSGNGVSNSSSSTAAAAAGAAARRQQRRGVSRDGRGNPTSPQLVPQQSTTSVHRLRADSLEWGPPPATRGTALAGDLEPPPHNRSRDRAKVSTTTRAQPIPNSAQNVADSTGRSPVIRKTRSVDSLAELAAQSGVANPFSNKAAVSSDLSSSSAGRSRPALRSNLSTESPPTSSSALPRYPSRPAKKADGHIGWTSPPANAPPRSPGLQGATGLTRSTTISSTARAKPTADSPANPNRISSYFVGYWAPQASNDANGSELATESDESLRQQMKEREALIGRGPYWAVQRGWTKGVVTSEEEATRRTRNFPGPVVKRFTEQQLDEALAFVRAGARAQKESFNDEDDDVPLSRRLNGLGPVPSKGAALGRSFSLNESIASRRGVSGEKSRLASGHRTARASPLKVSTGLANDAAMDDVAQGMARLPSLKFAETSFEDKDLLPAEQGSSASSGQSLSTSATSSAALSTLQIASVLPVLYVSSIPSSIEFYTSMLGLTVLSERGQEQASLAHGGSATPSLHLRKYVPAPSTPSTNPFLALKSPPTTSPPPSTVLFTLPSTPSSDPVTLQTTLNARLTTLRTSSSTANNPVIAQRWNRSAVRFATVADPGQGVEVLDPDGHIILLLLLLPVAVPAVASQGTRTQAGTAL